MTDLNDAVGMPARIDVGRAPARWALIVVAGFLGTVTNAIAFMLPPLLPDMQAQYHLGVTSGAWVFTAMTLASGAGFVLIPRLSDLRGDRATALASGLVMTVGALVAAVGHTYPALVIGAALMGLGSGSMLLPLVFLRRLLPGSAIGVAVRVSIIASGIGVVLGLTGGGVLVKYFSVDTFFYAMTVVLALTTVALVAVLPAERATTRGRMGVLGTVWMIGWLGLVLLALSQGTVWTGSLPYILLAAGLVAGVAWAVAERRSSTSVFDVSLLKKPYVSASCLSVGLFGATDGALLLLVTYYTQTPAAAGYGLGYDALKSSLLMLPFALSMFASGTAAEKFVEKGRPGVVLVFGGLVSAAGFLWLAVAHDQPWHYLVGSAIVGLGSRAGYSGGFAVPQYAVPEEKAGMASGMGGTAMAIGFAFGSAVITAVLGSGTDTATGLPKESLYTTGYVVAVAISVVVLVATGVSRLRHPRGIEMCPAAA
ncbi:MFS transporter [Amycolatopsis circi]|uniref:MFS transporter n=1 Tax=Amycolatopsis circi TaxID=871959 RepID=UPI000E26B896|nr:MFS transporter [Amycolatopsis circi]